MTLIETAIQNAKKLAAARAEKRALEPPLARQPQDRFRTAPQVQPGRPFRAAMVEPATMERNGVLPHAGDIIAERSYKILRTRVQQFMEASSWNSIAVTSAAAGDGKTLTAINLALALARDVNTWVFLVDLDLRRPQVASYLGMKFDKGLNNYLAGQATFDEIVYEPGVERLAVIPNAGPIEQSSELLGWPRMFELCQSLATEEPRRIVIFDMPPLLLSDDVLKFLPSVDSLLLVVSECNTPRAALQHALEALPHNKLLGVVLNRSASRDTGGYY